MTTNTRVGVNVSDDTTEAQTHVQGPIMELDRYGEPTGHSYYCCTLCGREAMYQSDLDDCCTEGDR
jgi:hypothetical protein